MIFFTKFSFFTLLLFFFQQSYFTKIRVVQSFSRAFTEANENFKELENMNAAYALSFSIIMLNTDAHSNQVLNKMTMEQFLDNNRGYNGGKDFPPQLMADLYNRIIYDEFKFKDPLFSNAVKKGFLQVKKSKGRILTRKRWFILCLGVLYESKYPPYIEDDDEKSKKKEKAVSSENNTPVTPKLETRFDLSELKFLHSGQRKVVYPPVAVLHVKNCIIKKIDEKSFAIYKDFNQCDIEFNQKYEDYQWQRTSKSNPKENYLLFTLPSSGTKRDLESWIRHLNYCNDKKANIPKTSSMISNLKQSSPSNK